MQDCLCAPCLSGLYYILLITAGERVGGCGQGCITGETRAMATRLPNRSRRHGNTKELALSRVTPIFQLSPSSCSVCVCPFHQGISSHFSLQLKGIQKALRLANKRICHLQQTHMPSSTNAYAIFCSQTPQRHMSSLCHCAVLPHKTSTSKYSSDKSTTISGVYSENIHHMKRV